MDQVRPGSTDRSYRGPTYRLLVCSPSAVELWSMPLSSLHPTAGSIQDRAEIADRACRARVLVKSGYSCPARHYCDAFMRRASAKQEATDHIDDK